MEVVIEEGSKKAGKAISALGLPKDCIIVTIYRAGKVIIPTGATVIQGGDKVVALTFPGKKKNLRSLFA